MLANITPFSPWRPCRKDVTEQFLIVHLARNSRARDWITKHECDAQWSILLTQLNNW